MATPTAIVAYLGLFAGAAVLFLFVNLLVGKLLRPKLPNQESVSMIVSPQASRMRGFRKT